MITLLFMVLFQLGDAERAYEEGRFGEAYTLFSEERATGPVLYNLGNCAFRLGRHAEAVYLYRCAQLRLPRDEELAFNLRLAEEKCGVQEEDTPSFGTAALGLIDSFLFSELEAFIVLLECIGLSGLVLLRRRPAARNAMALIVVLALLLSARLVRNQWFPGPPDGVVLQEKIALRPEPHIDHPATAEIWSGETVRIEAMSDRWALVEHARGRGWTERAGVGVVE
jgi:hypothetical protein